jgi:hypothetical protein
VQSADCGLRIADLKKGLTTKDTKSVKDNLKDSQKWAIESEHKGLGARSNVRALLIWPRRKEVGRGWKCWQHGLMSLPGLVGRRSTLGVQSSSAASWGNGRRFTRAVLECLNGNLGFLFGHAVLTAGEPECVFRFIS